MSAPKEKLNLYEVYWPIPLCEVYRIRATSKTDAMRRVATAIANGELHCVGETNGSSKKAILISEGPK